MVRGSRTPHKTQPMMMARVNEKGRMWGQQEGIPTVCLPPWSWYFGSRIWDLDLAIWEGLLLTDSAGQMFVRSFSIEGETRGRQSGVCMSRPGGTSQVQVASRKLWLSDALKIPKPWQLIIRGKSPPPLLA